MDTNTILSIIIIAGQIAMFFFFKEQIKSKNRVIEDLQTLIDTTDIKRLAEYYKTTDELRGKSILSRVDLEVDNWYKKTYANIGQQFDELGSFCASVIENLPTEKREDFIKETLPHCLSLFQKYIEADQHKKNEGDSQ